MAKTYTAQSIGSNHDIDVQVDGSGNITAWILQGEVDYDDGIRRGELLDIWPLLNAAQKQTLQTAYNQMRQAFTNHYLG